MSTMLKLIDILQEGILALTPKEREQIEEILPDIIKIISGKYLGDNRQVDVGSIDYVFADKKTPGTVKIFVGNDLSNEDSNGYFQTNDPKNPTDNIIFIQQFQFQPYFGIIGKTYSSLTGDKNQGIELLRKTLKHELIHAKDPAVNQHYLKEPYDSSKEEVYYESWAEFQTMTGQFFEAIIAGANRLVNQDLSEENVKKIENALKDILNFYSGKQASLSQDTVDFIQNTDKRNIFQSIIKFVENTVKNITGIGVINSLDIYVSYINQIKKYNPEGYKEFLTDLYKTIDTIKDNINNSLEAERQEYSDLVKKYSGSTITGLRKVPSNIKIREMQYINEAKRLQKLAGIITEEKQNQPSASVEDAEVDAAMKAGLSALTSGGSSLDEIKDDEQPQELNESVVGLIASGVLAAPKIIEWIGNIIGFITKPFRKEKDESAIAKKVEHFAHKWEKLYIKGIIWVVKKTKFVKQIWMSPDGKIDEQKLLVVAKYLYAGILAIALGNAMGTVLGSSSPIMKAIEASLGSVKAVEIAQIALKVKGQL